MNGNDPKETEPLPDSAAAEPALHPAAQFRGAMAAITPRVFITPLLIAINAGIFVAMVFDGAGFFQFDANIDKLLSWGANSAPLSTTTEKWRLLTAMFIHIGIIHILLNMIVLWEIGLVVERIIGPLGFLVAYVLSGLIASETSVLWNPEKISAGASGAILGIYGAFLGFLIRHGETIPRELLAALIRGAVFFLGINLLFGLAMPGIDMAAHVGGLVGGIACGLVLSHPLTPEAAKSRAWRAILSGAAGLALFAIFSSINPARGPFIQDAIQDAERKDYDAAIEKLDRIIERRPSNVQALLQRAFCRLQKKDYPEAIADFTKVMKWEPGFPGAYYSRGVAHIVLREYEEGVADLGEAIRLESRRDDSAEILTDYYLSRGLAYRELAEYKKAVEDFGEAIRRKPNQPEAYVNRAVAYTELGDYERAMKNFRMALEFNPKLPSIYHTRAFTHLRMGNAAEAEADWRKAAELTKPPKDKAGALENIGLIWLKAGDWEKAIENASEVAKLDPEMAWNSLFQWIAADKLQRGPEAEEAQEKWMRLKKPEDSNELRKLLPEELRSYLGPEEQGEKRSIPDEGFARPRPSGKPAQNPAQKQSKNRRAHQPDVT